MDNNKEIILKILEAIDYADDKQAFVDEFFKNVQTQTVVDLFQTLTPEKQDEFKAKLSESPDDPDKANEVFKTYFSDEQGSKAFEEATKNAVVDWMQAIESAISDEQKQKLVALSQELNPTPPSANLA